MKHISLSILFILLCCIARSQWLKASGKQVVDASGKEVILRGIGLGGWMLQEPYMLQLSGVATAQYDIRKKVEDVIGTKRTKRFYDAWLANHCTKADIDSLAAWGFNSVRLPMHYNLFTLPLQEEPVKDQHTWLEKGFALTDSLLSWCRANRMYLILDLHAAPGGQGSDNAIADRDTSKPNLWQSEGNRAKTIALWKQLATRYVNEEWLGAYDLINEPNWGFNDPTDKNGCAENSNEPLKQLLRDITTEIRKVDRKHMIIVEGNCWGNNYRGMLPLWDDNLVMSFHKYWNFTDVNSIKQFLDYREQYNLPIWMGESGENSNAWFTATIRLLEDHHIGWAWWPLKKLGINNPLQVKSNPGYASLVDFWKGKAKRPSAKKAFRALMQLAGDAHIANNIVHRDVVDAMIRQVQRPALLPFGDNVLQAEGILFATDYDLGRSGRAYYDVDSGNYWVSTGNRTEWNKGWQYRNDGVDIEACADSTTNGYSVGWTADGEWLHYTVTAGSEGAHQLHLRYATPSGGEVSLEVNSMPSTSATLQSTGGHSNWRTVLLGTALLKKGTNTIRLLIQKGGINLNYIRFIHQNLKANINK